MAFRLHETRQVVKEYMGMQDLMLKVSKSLAATPDLQTILQIGSDDPAKLSGLNSGAIHTLDDTILTLKATTPELDENPPEGIIKPRIQDHPHIHDALSRTTIGLCETLANIAALAAVNSSY